VVEFLLTDVVESCHAQRQVPHAFEAPFQLARVVDPLLAEFGLFGGQVNRSGASTVFPAPLVIGPMSGLRILLAGTVLFSTSHGAFCQRALQDVADLCHFLCQLFVLLLELQQPFLLAWG